MAKVAADRIHDEVHVLQHDRLIEPQDPPHLFDLGRGLVPRRKHEEYRVTAGVNSEEGDGGDPEEREEAVEHPSRDVSQHRWLMVRPGPRSIARMPGTGRR